jgi:riboflavin kinase / FMN adenylyltransferase
MRIVRHTREMPAEAVGAVAALGNFDGVHRGHQALIGEARRLARATNRPLACLVFEPYPREFFRPNDEPFRLTSFRAKAELLAELGVDFTIVIGFDAEMASMLAQDFILNILIGQLHAAHVVVGEDFLFGRGRAGDATLLAYMGEMEGFGVTVFAPVAAGAGAKISSSDIRRALKAGRPEEAARLLGHWWRVQAHVAPGDRRGRTLGYPTANLKLEHVLQPAFGVYAVRAGLGGDKGSVYDGVANFGVRPMFELTEPLMEVHLFDFSGELYGALMSVDLIAYLRSEAKFDSVAALKAQMAADCRMAERLLSQRERVPGLT